MFANGRSSLIYPGKCWWNKKFKFAINKLTNNRVAQMRKMLIEWLIEGGEQLKLYTRTIFQAIVLHDRFMHKSVHPLDF